MSAAGFPISAFSDLDLSPAFFASNLLRESMPVSITCTGREQSIGECDVFFFRGLLQPMFAGVVCVGQFLMMVVKRRR